MAGSTTRIIFHLNIKEGNKMILKIVLRMAKAIVAGLIPWALPLVHSVGLTEVTTTGLETIGMSLFSALAVYWMPNKE